MRMLGIALVLLVALEHLYFLYLEMFLWTRPKGLRIFGNTAEKAEASRVLAANQGLYNGFLAAGLLWGLVYPGVAGIHVQMFFLVCVIVAGAMAASRSGGPSCICRADRRCWHCWPCWPLSLPVRSLDRGLKSAELSPCWVQ